MPYEWEGNSGNSVFLVLVYQREMERRKFFAFNVMKKISPERIPNRFYAKDVIDILLGLPDMPYSRNLLAFLCCEYNFPCEVCISSVGCFTQFVVSPGTLLTLPPTLKLISLVRTKSSPQGQMMLRKQLYYQYLS